MNRKKKIIIYLLAIVIVLLCVIRFCIVHAIEEKQAEYARKQTDALTHDISGIEDYRSTYAGDASNIANLFYALPLGNVSMNFQLNSETCALKVNYLSTVQNIGEEKVQRDLIYNSAAAMAAIDNLSEITYCFSDESYSFDRKQMETVFGSPLSDLLEPEKWDNEVQGRLSTADFVEQFFENKQ